MILVTSGVVLSRRSHREFDRMAFLYTKDLGKVAVRFPGVDRPRGKLKALSEPMIHAEYRLYGRAGSAWLTVTGGRIIDSYPGLRGELGRTLRGLEMCELLLRLTPDGSPNDRKFDLIVDHLEALEHAPSPALAVSFGLRLLALAGLEPNASHIHPRDHALWRRLTDTAPAALGSPPLDAGGLERLRAVVERISEHHMEANLKTRLFRERFESAEPQRACVPA